MRSSDRATARGSIRASINARLRVKAANGRLGLLRLKSGSPEPLVKKDFGVGIIERHIRFEPQAVVAERFPIAAQQKVYVCPGSATDGPGWPDRQQCR